MNRICIAALVAVAGCAGTAYVPTTQYVLAPSFTVEEVASQGITLGIRPLEDMQSQRRDMTYLDTDRALRAYPYAQWADAAGAMVTRALIDAALQTARFEDVGDTANLTTRPGINVVGELRRFTEVRTSEGSQAQCRIHLEARALDGEAWIWDFSASEPMTDSTPMALAAAMEIAVGRVASEAAAALAGIDFDEATP
jgi:ABC-type uncharacterized transport system auxiliary subunit